MKVGQIMTKDVYTCRTIDTLDRAAELMLEHEIGSLPVVDENGHVVGMITDRDICMATFTHDAPPRAIAVGLTMSPHPTTCARDDELVTVEDTMRAHQIHRVPVVDDAGHPVGIISLNDLARAAHQGAGVSSSEVADTLAAVCADRPLL
jgi:CBS domain-containing protein